MLHFKRLESNEQAIRIDYEYEDNDIQAILLSRLKQLYKQLPQNFSKKIHILAAVDDIIDGQLEQRLQQDKANNQGKRIILIPCNLGNSHWVGIIIEFDIGDQIIRSQYIDSLNGSTIIPKRLQTQFIKVHQNNVLKTIDLLKQDDLTSCGAYTIENLLMAAQGLLNEAISTKEIRQLHLECLKLYNSEFYEGFYIRQRDNKPTTASLHEQLMYIENLKNVWFSKQELNRILAINASLNQINTMKDVLLNSFQQKEIYKTTDKGHALHLSEIRESLKKVAITLNLQENNEEEKEQFKIIIKLLFDVKWQFGKDLNINKEDVDFRVSYNEILAVANNISTLEQVVNVNYIQENIRKQIEEDEKFAIKLQQKLWMKDKVNQKVMCFEFEIEINNIEEVILEYKKLTFSDVTIKRNLEEIFDNFIPKTLTLFRQLKSVKLPFNPVTGFIDRIKTEKKSIKDKGSNQIEKGLAKGLLKKVINYAMNISNNFYTEKPVYMAPTTYNNDKLLYEQERLSIEHCFNTTLQKIKTTAFDKYWTADCFISYAWPYENSEIAKQEVKIQEFLKTLRNQLDSCGIKVYLDIVDNEIVRSPNDYMKKIEHVKSVIVLLTKSLLIKHQNGNSTVCSELNAIKQRKEKDKEFQIIPILLNGDFSSVPNSFPGYRNILDWSKKSYVENMETLIRGLYKLGPGVEDYKNIWKDFKNGGSNGQFLPKNMPEKTAKIFSLDTFLIKSEQINIGQEIGRGGFGIVYKGTWEYSDSPIAIKQLLEGNDISSEAKKEFKKEVTIMSQLKHPNVLVCYGFYLSPKYSMVMEYMPKGSLYRVNRYEEPLPWSIRIKIAMHITKGISFLHERNIIHRDIKSLNVLLDDNYNAKLSDFGLSKVKSETKAISTANKTDKDSVGAIQWMAPELFKLKPMYTTKSDIYSLGITFWELAARKLPYSEVDKNVIPISVLQGKREEIPEECPEKMAQLIRDCWETSPEKRPDAKDIVERLKEVTLSLVKNEFEVLDKEVKGGSSPSIQWFYNSNYKTYWIGKCSDKGIVCQKEDGALTSPDTINEYKEYIAIKLYALFGVSTPEVVLNKQIISKKAQTTYKFAFDEHKKTYGKLPSNVPELHEPRLHLMSRYVDGFKDLGENFIDFYQKQSKDEYYKVEGVPLKGFGRALAVATFLYDYDCIGNSGGNMGYVLKGSHAQIVKIDAGEALPFVDDLSKAQGVFHDPRTRDMLTGTGGTKIAYLQLNKEDQKEFASAAREILECLDNQLSNVFQEALSVDSRFDEVLKHLKKRKSKFLDAFSPEVKELLNEQILYYQKLLEQLEHNIPSTSYISIDKLQVQNKQPILFMHKKDSFGFVDQSLEDPNSLFSQNIENYGHWAIRMRRLPNDEVVCGFGDGTFKIFNIKNGEIVKSVKAHSDRLWDCTIFQNKYLVTCSQDRSIKFWDKFGHGDCIKTFEYEADVISVCDISNNKFAVAASDAKVTIWDFSTGKVTNVLIGHQNVVQCLVYIPEKNILASSAGDAVIYIWSLDNFKPLNKLKGHEKLIFDLRKLDNNFLISSCDDNTAKIWDPDSGKCVLTLSGHQHFVNGTSQLPNGNIVTSSEDKTIKIWDNNTGECLKTIAYHDQPVWGMETYTINDDQINILSGDTKGSMFFSRLTLSLENEKIFKTVSLSSQIIENYGHWAIRMRRLPNDEVVCGFGDGTFKIFNIRNGKVVKSVQAHNGRVWDCTIFQNKYLVTCSQDKSIKFWDKFGHGDCVKTFEYEADVISVCDISNNKFAIAARNSKVAIWNFSTGQITNVLTGHQNVVQCLVYIPEKNILASSAGDAVIYIWSLDNFKPLNKLTGHSKLIFDLRKLDNNFLISSCDDYTAKIWDPDSGECVLTLAGHQHFVNGTSQLPNGNIVTSSEDKTIKIWDNNTGECLKTIACHDRPVWGMETYTVNNTKINILSGDTKGEIFFNRLNISLENEKIFKNSNVKNKFNLKF